MGAELFAHFQTEASRSSELEALAEDLDQPSLGGDERMAMIGRLDAHSEAAEGKELEMIIDAERVLLFDAETGENLGLH